MRGFDLDPLTYVCSTLFAHSVSCALRCWREVPQRGPQVAPDRGTNRENPRYIGRDADDGGVVSGS